LVNEIRAPSEAAETKGFMPAIADTDMATHHMTIAARHAELRDDPARRALRTRRVLKSRADNQKQGSSVMSTQSRPRRLARIVSEARRRAILLDPKYPPVEELQRIGDPGSGG
jgi:hypothetical protein